MVWCVLQADITIVICNISMQHTLYRTIPVYTTVFWKWTVKFGKYRSHQNFTFTNPCILINYESNKQDATIQVNLLFLVSSTCFGRCFRPSSGALDCIYSICFLKLLPAGSLQQLEWTLPDTVNTVKCSWWWAKTLLETCRADLE